MPTMKRKNWGRIVFFSSGSGVQIHPEVVYYDGVGKASQIALARGLAETLAQTGIAVSSVLPGSSRVRGQSVYLESLSKAGGKPLETIEWKFFDKFRPTSQAPCIGHYGGGAACGRGDYQERVLEACDGEPGKGEKRRCVFQGTEP